MYIIFFNIKFWFIYNDIVVEKKNIIDITKFHPITGERCARFNFITYTSKSLLESTIKDIVSTSIVKLRWKLYQNISEYNWEIYKTISNFAKKEQYQAISHAYNHHVLFLLDESCSMDMPPISKFTTQNTDLETKYGDVRIAGTESSIRWKIEQKEIVLLDYVEFSNIVVQALEETNTIFALHRLHCIMMMINHGYFHDLSFEQVWTPCSFELIGDQTELSNEKMYQVNTIVQYEFMSIQWHYHILQNLWDQQPDLKEAYIQLWHEYCDEIQRSTLTDDIKNHLIGISISFMVKWFPMKDMMQWFPLPDGYSADTFVSYYENITQESLLVDEKNPHEKFSEIRLLNKILEHNHRLITDWHKIMKRG